MLSSNNYNTPARPLLSSRRIRSGLAFPSATGLRRGLYSHVPGEPAQLARIHPLDLQVLEQFPVRHPEPPPFRDAHLVRLDLRGRIRVIEALREQLLPFAELPHMDEFVHDVEIDIPPVARPQVVRRDHEVAVLVAHSHIAPLGREELDLECAEDGLCPRSENPTDGVDVLEALEVIKKTLVPKANVPRDLDIGKFCGRVGHRFRTPDSTRRASLLWDFGSSLR